MAEFNPRNLIDRSAEQEMFGNLISFKTPARMLMICAPNGCGKSSLLKRLEYNCRYGTPPLAVSLIALDQLSSNPTSFNLVEQIIQEMKIPRGLSEPKLFPKFLKLNKARIGKNYKPFGRIPLLVNINGKVEASSIADHSTGVGVKVGVINVPALEFTEEQERFARQRCVEAFFEDIGKSCASRPMILIFDSWERCNSTLQEWILTRFLANYCFHVDKKQRPNQLAIVIAGRTYSNNDPLGIDKDQFCRLLFMNNEQEFLDTVLSRETLSIWEPEHLRDFFVLQGYTQYSEDDVIYFQRKLKGGLSVANLTDAIDSLKP